MKIQQLTWSAFLDDQGYCREDSQGNRPCSNDDVTCDRCEMPGALAREFAQWVEKKTQESRVGVASFAGTARMFKAALHLAEDLEVSIDRVQELAKRNRPFLQCIVSLNPETDEAIAISTRGGVYIGLASPDGPMYLLRPAEGKKLVGICDYGCPKCQYEGKGE